jgi:hypothetical protein
VWRVDVQITEFKTEGDSDIHLVMFADGAYGIAEMPAAECLPKKTRDRKAIIAARKRFTANCGHRRIVGSSWARSSRSMALASLTFGTPRSRTH